MEEKAEQALYDAIAAVVRIQRPNWRRMAWSAARDMIDECLAWNAGRAEVKYESNDEKNPESIPQAPSAHVEKLPTIATGESAD